MNEEDAKNAEQKSRIKEIRSVDNEEVGCAVSVLFILSCVIEKCRR